MRGRDMGLAAAASAVWGLALVAIPSGLESFSAPQLTALRFLVAALPVVVVPRPPLPWGAVVLIGSTLFTGQFLLLFARRVWRSRWAGRSAGPSATCW